jgi:ATP-binding cassette subfamily F protein uup
VYDVEDVSIRAGERPLLRDATWRVGPGERVAVVGVNGSGKTTLLRLLVGELQPDSGRVRVGATVRPAYLSQQVAELPAGLRVLEAVEEIARHAVLGGVEQSASQLLERFGFPSARQWTPWAICPAASGDGCSCCVC